ncbi:MAG: hypothetical protein NVS4B2_33060 [Chloroflexota bacterium]
MHSLMGTHARRPWTAWLRAVGALAVLLTFVVPQAPARADTTGAQHFWIATGTGWTYVPCRLAGSGPRVHVYLAPGTALAGRAGAQIVSTVEAKILPAGLKLFGTPHNLGVINILILPLHGRTLGYFDESDIMAPHPRGETFHANDANILYIRSPETMPDREKMTDFYEVVAHELQHLLEFRLRVVDRHEVPQALWLNEGLSFYAQLASGFWTAGDRLKLAAAANEPAWRVSGLNPRDTTFNSHARAAYGRAGLFVCYLASRFGPTFVRRLVTSRLTGMQAIDSLLRARHDDIRQVFADWAVALYVKQGTDGTFGRLIHGYYPPPRLSVPTVTGYPFDSGSAPARPLRLSTWANGYVQFSTSGRGTLRVTTQSRADRLRAGLILENTDNGTKSRTYWLQPAGPGRLSLQMAGFGNRYESATLVLSAVTTPTGACDEGSGDVVRVQASLVRTAGASTVVRQALRSPDRSLDHRTGPQRPGLAGVRHAGVTEQAAAAPRARNLLLVPCHLRVSALQ